MARTPPRNLVAVLPAAGHATRLEPLRKTGALSGSKEVHAVPGLDDSRSRPACLHLLESLALVGVDRAFVVVRKGKEDIPNTLGSGASLAPDWRLDLAYLWVEDSRSVPETLDRAWNHIRGHRVFLGFPDTLFEPQDAFVHLLREQEMSGADLVLGLFPTDRPETTDMVAVDAVGTITAIEVRPQETDLTHNWLLALWTPRFSAFLHNQVSHHRAARRQNADRETPELQLGRLFQTALAAGFTVQGVPFRGGRYVDVGSPRGVPS